MNKEKKYIRIIVFESILLLFSTTLAIFLYFKYEVTSGLIEDVYNSIRLLLLNIGEYIHSTYKEFKIVFPDFSSIFNNREVAILILVIICFFALIIYRKTRKNIIDIVKIFFSKQFIRMNLLMAVFVVIITIVLNLLGFWELALLKSTTVWFLTAGLFSAYTAVDKAKDLNYFLSAAKNNFRIVIVIEFVAHLYSFSLIKELVIMILLIIFSFLLGLAQSIAKRDNVENTSSITLFSIVISVIGIYWLFNSIILLINNWSSIDHTILIKELILTPLLSIIFLLCIYMIVLIAIYETQFIRINCKKIIAENIRRYLKIRIVIFCNFNIKKVLNIHLHSDLLRKHISSKKDVKAVIESYKKGA